MENSLTSIIKNDSKLKIINICDQIINDEINYIDASREINRLRFNIDDSENNIFNIFVLVDSDTDYLPRKANQRANFNQEYLSKMDLEAENYIKEMREGIIQASKDLKKYLLN